MIVYIFISSKSKQYIFYNNFHIEIFILFMFFHYFEQVSHNSCVVLHSSSTDYKEYFTIVRPHVALYHGEAPCGTLPQKPHMVLYQVKLHVVLYHRSPYGTLS